MQQCGDRFKVDRLVIDIYSRWRVPEILNFPFVISLPDFGRSKVSCVGWYYHLSWYEDFEFGGKRGCV